MEGDAITRDQVLHVAQLANLALEEQELEAMTRELGAILRYMDKLNELDTSRVPPTAQVGVDALPLRRDEPHQSLPREAVLQQAPSTAHDGFVVPAFMDE